ncbi:MAG: tetratricopeptide repeat protein [Deltaproteobacteria bacterium]|nr:tetratricopeptide repeat protein [Deltaproteobacteria bacterium]
MSIPLPAARIVALALAVGLVCASVVAQARQRKHPKIVTPPPATAATSEEDAAQASTDTAKKSFVAGSEHYAAGRYAEAAAEFQKAYDLTRSPEILYNIGRCHEELKDEKQAISDYETYLSLAPAAPDVADVKQRIEGCKEREKQQEIAQEQARKDAEEKAAEDKARQEVEARKKAEAAAWAKAVRLGGELGVGVPLTGDATSMNLPVEIFLHYPVLDWLYVTGVLDYTSYFNDEKPLDPLYNIGLAVGATGLFPLNLLLAAKATVGLGVAEVICSHEKVTWIPIRAGGGLEIRVTDSFRVVVDALVAVGPVFNPTSKAKNKLTNPGVQTDLQLKAGVEYVFN